MKQNPDWLSVDSDINQPFQKERNGIQVTFKVAPQNVPNAFRFGFDSEKQKLFVEFRYSGYESTELKELKDGIAVRVGVSTGRLYRIEIPKRLAVGGNQKYDISSMLEQTFEQAIDILKKQTTYSNGNVSEEYFDLTRNVVHKFRDQFRQTA